MKKIILFIIISLALTSCSKYSEGERVGIITKFSESGRVFKSFEGELKVAPNLANSGMVGQYETFVFSLDNSQSIKCETPIDSIKKFAQKGTPIVINYQEIAYLNWFQNRGNTQHFVKSIVPVK